jgi:hypothetical protein
MGYSVQNLQVDETCPIPVLAIAYNAPSSVSENNAQKNVLMLAAVLSVLQIIDGLLTAHGLDLYGIESEGNAGLRYLMQYIGIGPTILFVKSLAIGVIYSVCRYGAPKVKWVPTAMKSLIVVYTFAAVIPWTAIILQNYIY